MSDTKQQQQQPAFTPPAFASSRKEQSTDHIRRGVHYRRSDQDVENLAGAADVVLETRDTRFPAHFAILGLNSSVFCDLHSRCKSGGAKSLQSSVGHVVETGETVVIHLEEETRDVKQLLRFLYDRYASKHGLVRYNPPQPGRG